MLEGADIADQIGHLDQFGRGMAAGDHDMQLLPTPAQALQHLLEIQVFVFEDASSQVESLLVRTVR
jgi:hypothetical protein